MEKGTSPRGEAPCSLLTSWSVAENPTGNDEAQCGYDRSENHLRRDVPHVQVLHHEVQKDGIADQEGNHHNDIQRELTADHVSFLVPECPEFLKRKVQSRVQDEPNHRREDIPNTQILCEAVQGCVVGNNAGGSCNAEPHDLPEARRFGSHCGYLLLSFLFGNVLSNNTLTLLWLNVKRKQKLFQVSVFKKSL